jgi:Mg-chelatase subunit ChlD
VARRLELQDGEPLYLTNCEAPDRHLRVPGWYAEKKLGPDGCLVSGEVLANLGVPAEGYIFLDSAKPPQPSFHLFCWTYEDVDEEPAPEDLLVLLDVSGSMEGAPLRSAKRALLGFLDRRRERQRELRLEDRLGLITFGGVGREGVHLICPPAADNRGTFVEAIEAAEAGGATPIGEALEIAIETMQALGSDSGDSTRRRLILVTDGHPYPAEAGSLERIFEELVREDIRVATVGVGEHFDRELLSSLAARTEAPFVEVQRMRDLILLLEELA